MLSPSSPVPATEPLRARRTRRRTFGVVLAATVAAIGAVAPTTQASLVVSGTDPGGDAASPFPGHDIVGISVAFSPHGGQMRAQVRLRGTPSTDAAADLHVFAGYRTAAGCTGFPAIGFSTLDTASDAHGVRLAGSADDALTYDARKRGGGTAVQELELAEVETILGAFSGVRPNCVIARTAQASDTQVVYDTAGPYTLRRLPELTATLGKTSASLRPGRTRTVRLTLRNPGDAKTGRIRLSVRRARGLTVRHARRVAAIAAGKSRRVSLRVTLSRRAKATTTLTVKATAPKKLSAVAKADLYRHKPSSGSGGGGGGGSKLCYRYSWLPPYSQLVPC